MSVASHSSAAFDAIATHYDEMFTRSLIGQAQRRAVWDIARTYLSRAGSVLELNCGTGEDALFLADLGMEVLACDVSIAMIDVARKKAALCSDLTIDFRVLAIEDLESLTSDDDFDAVFSNFSGLNCVADLRTVTGQLAKLMRTGARAVLCFSNKYCFWEIAWYVLHGQFRRAFRRWSSGPVSARIGEHAIEVRYPTISQLTSTFSPYFSVVAIHGVGMVVPPSYLEAWVRRIPGVIRAYEKFDKFVSHMPFWRSIGDHCVLVLERKPA